jgi:hypothetical protein
MQFRTMVFELSDMPIATQRSVAHDPKKFELLIETILKSNRCSFASTATSSDLRSRLQSLYGKIANLTRTFNERTCWQLEGP